MAVRGAPTATTDPYSALAKITDPHLRASLKLILDQVADLRGRAGGIGRVSQPLGTPLDAAGHALTQIADPQDPGDAVNLRTLQQYVEGILSGAIPKPAARPAPTPTAPTPAGPIDPPPPPPPPPPGGGGEFPTPQAGTGNIRIAGKFFRKPDGSLYRWKSATDFLLFKFFLDGVDITPILANRTAAGATMVRVLGMCINITTFRPADYPNYLAQLPVFAALLAANGLDFEFTVFADAQMIPAFSGVSDQRAWLTSVRNALINSPNVVLELVNEGYKNGVDFKSHTRPVGIISCADANQPPDDAPAMPPWDYATLHTPRDNEWPRKAKDSMEVADQLKRPAIDDEPMGAFEENVPGRRSNVPDDFYYYAAVGMLLGGGATFHSEDGIFSRPWGPIQTACANSFYTALNVIPESVIVGGTYTRGPLADCPIQHDDALAIRTYARYTANEAVCVAVRPQPAWVAIAQAGWTIVSQTGPGNCVVFLTR